MAETGEEGLTVNLGDSVGLHYEITIRILCKKGWDLERKMSGRREVSFIMCESLIQVDTSGCSLGLVDNKTKVAFKCKENILKCNLCFDVNTTLGTT